MTPIEDAAVIGRSIKIQGEISGEQNLQVLGVIEGVVRLAGATLTIRPEGRIHAAIQAQNVVVFGRVEGQIQVAGGIELRSGSEVRGDIFAAHISVEEGAVLSAQLDPSRATEVMPEPSQPANQQLEFLHRSLDAWLAPQPDGRATSPVRDKPMPVLHR